MSPEDSYSRERFLFTSEALQDEHALHVVRFSGHEGLNELYAFEITIATTEKSLPLDDILSRRAKFTILGKDTPDAKFSGFVTKIVQTSRYNDWTFYQLTLQPGFWYYTQTVQNNFFIGKTVKELLDGCLDRLDSCSPSREFKLEASYKAQPFSMQHNETLHDYMSWKMERDGIYYYFEEKDEGEHLVFTDSKSSHMPLDKVKSLRYSPTSGMENAHQDEVITSFAMNCSPLPKWVVLRDYNWRDPNTPVIAKELVSEKGLGEVYYYGEGYDTADEGNRLAAIRAEALRCRARTWNGASAVPCLRPGRNFTLDNHYDDSFNREYTITSVTHEGSQEAHLSQAIGVPIDNPDKVYYRNSFACIASDQQFRPERKTQRAKVSGMITAFIDSSSNSSVAEINDEGCYKVYFPQDNSGRGAGKASCWIRRMQPQVGQSYGFTLPLAPGVEVLVTFMDGDPDRPVIAGAVSNAESGYMEHSGSTQATGLNTSGGNALVFNEQGTKQGLALKTGGNSALVMGSGSTSTNFQCADNVFESYSSISSQEAGMINDVQAGFEQVVSADHGAYSGWKTIVAELLSQALTLGEWFEKSESVNEEADEETQKKTDKALDALTGSVTGLKSVLQMLLMMKRAAENDQKFSTALTSSDDSCTLSMKTSLNAKEIGKYFVFWLIKNAGKIGVDAASYAIEKKDTDDNYTKKSLTRNYVSETVPTLAAELTAIFATWGFRKKLMKGDQPKGVLFQSENGPLITKSSEDTVMLSNKGLLMSAIESSNTDPTAGLDPSKYNESLRIPDNSITSQANHLYNFSLDGAHNISCGEIQSSAPNITITTKYSQDFDTRFKKLIKKVYPDNIDIADEYKQNYKISDDSKYCSTITLKTDPSSKASSLILENTKGDISINNKGKDDSSSISIIHKSQNDDNNIGLKIKNKLINCGFFGLDKLSSMTHDDNGVSKKDDFTKIEINADNEFNVNADKILLDFKNELNIKMGDNETVLYFRKAAKQIGYNMRNLQIDTDNYVVSSSIVRLC